MNIGELLTNAALRSPDIPAVTDGARTLSYAQLAQRAGSLAGALKQRCGLRPGERVVLCMENCRAYFEVLFACWIAGACAVPANAKLHPREVAHIVENSRARVCFTTEGLYSALGQLPGDIESLEALIVADSDDYEKLLRAEPIRAHEASAEDDAWLFYTSGTTGRPKGAVLSHRNLLFMTHCYFADIDFLDERDTKLHVAPLSHASGLYALPQIARGGHQVILGKSFDPAEVFDAIEAYRNVTLFSAPTMVSRLVNSNAAARADTRNLKTIYYGGGPMYVSDLKRALEIFGPKLYQLFGQGESPMTITGLSKRLHAATDLPHYEEMLGSTGFPRTGVEVRVVDDEDRELPAGEIGEVITRSDCVMKEYWGDPEATRRTLRGGWLHTGDLGAMHPNGFLVLHDRSKDMIISGGANIYPREVEEVLVRHPDLLEVSVVGRPHPDWGEEVVAFIVPRQGATVTPEALDALCLENIARFKRPKHYRYVEALPKNNYGKVLKTELRTWLQQDDEVH